MTPQEKVQDAIKKGIEKIELVFAPLITAIDIQIGKLEKAGKDPSNYYDLDEDRHINFIEKRDLYASEKEKAILEFQAKMDEEVAKMENMPDTETGGEQDIPWEKIVFYIVKSALENGVRITIGDYKWDSGHPIGRKGEFFYELRDDALQAIGIEPDSDLGKVVKDPFNSLRDLGKNIDRETDEALTRVRVATDKALDDAKRETDEALTRVKVATDKALTDARKTTDKAIKDVGREIGRGWKKLKKIKIKL